jgi:hypothetical protein
MIPVTTPVPPTTVATVVVPLVHVPPVVPSVKVIVVPPQKADEVEMVPGSVFTVTTVVV